MLLHQAMHFGVGKGLRRPGEESTAPGHSVPRTAGGLVEVHVDALQLQVGVAVVGAGGVNAVLIADDLREGRGELSVFQSGPREVGHGKREDARQTMQ